MDRKFFLINNDFMGNNSLGPIQYKPLIQYLKDMKLTYKINDNTVLGNHIKKELLNNKIEQRNILLFLWINLVFSSTLFFLWTNFKNGIYGNNFLINRLLKDFGIYSIRSKINDYNALVSTLERTLIVNLINQIRVIKNFEKDY